MKSAFIVGVEGSAHHGMLEILPVLNMLAHQTDKPKCLRIKWESFPRKCAGLDEAARTSLIYGNSCALERSAGWRGNCSQVGTWRCNLAEDMYRELVWRFEMWPSLYVLPSPKLLEYTFIVLRRDFMRTVYSHTAPTGKNHRLRTNALWDGGVESHALLLGAMTTLISSMLERVDRNRWASLDPDRFSSSDPVVRAQLLRSLAAWLGWMLPATHREGVDGGDGGAMGDSALLETLERSWRSSSKDPATGLSAEQQDFLRRFVVMRRSDGSWAALDDPSQDVTKKIIPASHFDSPSWPGTKPEVSGFHQSVKWPLERKDRGPFGDACPRPPNWSALIEEEWKRDSELPLA